MTAISRDRGSGEVRRSNALPKKPPQEFGRAAQVVDKKRSVVGE